MTADNGERAAHFSEIADALAEVMAAAHKRRVDEAVQRFCANLGVETGLSDAETWGRVKEALVDRPMELTRPPARRGAPKKEPNKSKDVVRAQIVNTMKLRLNRNVTDAYVINWLYEHGGEHGDNHPWWPHFQSSIRALLNSVAKGRQKIDELSLPSTLSDADHD